jgi:hypothetical protein
MMNMPYFSRALAAYLQGPPRRQQAEFAMAAGIARSKLCRLLQNSITCGRECLDTILGAIPDPKARQTLVIAHIRDKVSPVALLHLKTNQANEWEGFDFRPLSRRGRATLKAILHGANVSAFEKLLEGAVEFFNPRGSASIRESRVRRGKHLPVAARLNSTDRRGPLKTLTLSVQTSAPAPAAVRPVLAPDPEPLGKAGLRAGCRIRFDDVWSAL